MTIATWGAGLLAVLAMAHIAAAQPAPEAAPGDPAPPAPEAAPAPPAPAPAPAIAPPDTGRPSGLAVGIGAGYVLPTSLQTPNVTSVRVRLASGVTLEPQLAIARTSDSVDTGATVTNRQTEVTLGSQVRHPLRARGKIDLELIGGAAISTRFINAAGNDNDRTITTLGLSYGVAIAYWFTAHWNLSFTGTNPLLAYTRTRQEMAAATTLDTSTTVGLVFEPQVAVMIHLYD